MIDRRTALPGSLAAGLAARASAQTTPPVEAHPRAPAAPDP
jgi:hypothetical protein